LWGRCGGHNAAEFAHRVQEAFVNWLHDLKFNYDFVSARAGFRFNADADFCLWTAACLRVFEI
jgi:hypothetical protein